MPSFMGGGLDGPRGDVRTQDLHLAPRRAAPNLAHDADRSRVVASHAALPRMGTRTRVVRAAPGPRRARQNHLHQLGQRDRQPMSHGVLREFHFDDALVRGHDAVVDARHQRRAFRLVFNGPGGLQVAQEAHDAVRVGNGRHRPGVDEAVEFRRQAGVLGEVGLRRHPSGGMVRPTVRVATWPRAWRPRHRSVPHRHQGFGWRLRNNQQPTARALDVGALWVTGVSAVLSAR